MIKCAIVVAMAMMIVQGCQTGQKAQTAAPKAPKVLTINVTQDQKFLYKGSLLNVKEFFAQADYADDSMNVIIDVHQDSEITENTIVEAITFLKQRGYVVAMSDTSKYANLIP